MCAAIVRRGTSGRASTPGRARQPGPGRRLPGEFGESPNPSSVCCRTTWRARMPSNSAAARPISAPGWQSRCAGGRHRQFRGATGHGTAYAASVRPRLSASPRQRRVGSLSGWLIRLRHFRVRRLSVGQSVRVGSGGLHACCARGTPGLSRQFVPDDAVRTEEWGIAASDRLLRPAFGMYRFEWPGEPSVQFLLSHGDWIRVLRRSGFCDREPDRLRPPAAATTNRASLRHPGMGRSVAVRRGVESPKRRVR